MDSATKSARRHFIHLLRSRLNFQFDPLSPHLLTAAEIFLFDFQPGS